MYWPSLLNRIYLTVIFENNSSILLLYKLFTFFYLLIFYYLFLYKLFIFTFFNY